MEKNANADAEKSKTQNEGADIFRDAAKKSRGRQIKRKKINGAMLQRLGHLSQIAYYKITTTYKDH